MKTQDNLLKDDIGSLRFWIHAWQEAVNAQTGGYASRRLWDRMAPDYDRADEGSIEKNAEAEKLVAELAGRGLFREGFRVLDVGCGTGRMAMTFAEHGADVVALDFSPAMLERLRTDLPGGLAHRISLVEADWSDIDLGKRKWDRAFDLVFAHMTPAIRTPEAFLKLQNASRWGCYFRGWAGHREDPLREDIRRHLDPKPSPTPTGVAANAIIAFNLLCAMGCSPSFEFQEVCWEKRLPVKNAVCLFTEYFDEFSDLPREELDRQISKYLEDVAEEGCVIRSMKGRTASMFWRVVEQK